MRASVRDFFTAIFGDALCSERRLAIWTSPTRSTKFFSNSKAAADYTRSIGDQDVYFGLSLIEGRPRGRGKYSNCAGIGALWADIDIKGPGHSKQNLPPDEDAVRVLLERIGLPPSIIVHSGHVYQVLWLLREPLVFKDDADRNKAAKLTKDWSDYIRANAKGLNWDVDGVGDLTRLFRVPGSRNHKRAPVVDVRIIETHLDRRYALGDVWRLIDGMPNMLGRAETRPREVNLSSVPADAKPPPEKFAYLMGRDEKFRNTWDRRRPDLQDQSASGYDMALTHIAVMAGWSDYEIACLLVEYRRRFGEDIAKAQRLDYLARTIGKARARARQEGALGALIEAGTAASQRGMDGQPSEEERARILELFGDFVGVRVKRFVKHGREGSTHSLVLEDGRDVLIGVAKQVLSADAWSRRLLDAAGVVLDAPTGRGARGRWREIVRALMLVVEVVENEEANRATRWGEYVREYFASRTVYSEEEWPDALPQREPFRRKGKLALSAGDLRRWLKAQLDIHVTDPQLHDALRVLGFEGNSLTARTDCGGVTCRFYWTADEDRVSAAHAEGEEIDPQDAGGAGEKREPRDAEGEPAAGAS
jgi:hypothetical protein